MQLILDDGSILVTKSSSQLFEPLKRVPFLYSLPMNPGIERGF